MTATTITSIESPGYRKLRQRVGVSLVIMAILHAIAHKFFEAMIPKPLGAPKFWNVAAGVAEGTAGALLLSSDPQKHKAGGALATATFIGVYPANIKMALEAGPPTNPKAIGLWLRLPLQFPMIASGIRLAKGEG